MNKEAKAKLSFLKSGPRKVRLVADMIRGKKVSKAIEILSLSNKLAARHLLKLLKSAIANAKHNLQIDEANLRVESIMVDGGPVLKRWMPKAHGRATPVRERTSHAQIVLKEIEQKEKIKKEKK
jgi:large subunit ribosomal protein L22